MSSYSTLFNCTDYTQVFPPDHSAPECKNKPNCEHYKTKPYYCCSIDDKFWFCVKCLWILTEPLKEHSIPKSHFDLNEDYFQWDEGSWQDLKKTKNNFHYQRVANANVNYAILCTVCNNNLTILDGCHRFIASNSQVLCKIVSPEDLAKIAYTE